MKRRNLEKAVLAAGIFIMLLVSPLQSMEPAGKVIALRGNVTAEEGQSGPRILVMNSTIFAQDVIKTGKRGRVQLLFRDKTLISLGVSTEMKIAEYSWDENERSGAMMTDVREGVFRVLGGAITSETPENFKTETPAATIGIRGSLYMGRVSGNSLSVMLQGGVGVDVTNEFGTVALLKPGYGTVVNSAVEKPQSPFRFSGESISGLNESLTGENALSDKQVEDDMEGGEGDGAGDGEADPGTGDGADDDQPEETGGEMPESEGSLSEEETVVMGSGVDITDPLVGGPDFENDLVEIPEPPVEDPTVPEPPVPEPPVVDPVVYPFSGKYMNLSKSDASVPIETTGAVGATNTDGSVTGAIVYSDSTTTPLTYEILGFDPASVYTMANETVATRDIILEGQAFTTEMKLFSSPLGEFSAFSISDYIADVDGTQFHYWEAGFAGVPSGIVQTTGLDFYHGFYLGTQDGIGTQDYNLTETGNVFMEINWQTGKVIGHLDSKDSNGGGPTFFGNINSDGSVNVIFSGMSFKQYDPNDPNPGPGIVEWADGVSDFGQIYGSINQGFGLTGNGLLYDISNQTDITGDFSITLAAFIEEPHEVQAPTGTETWQGFVTGFSENMNDPGLDRRLFVNVSADEFTLVLNKDTGSVTGSIFADEVMGFGYGPISVTIGANGESAYILDDHFIAILDDGTDPVAVADYFGITDFKEYGNFLITEQPADAPDPVGAEPNPKSQFSDYMTWGYWEVAYYDADMNADYHLHYPGSLWIAGSKTTETYVRGMIDNNLTATYTGKAYGIGVNSIDPMVELTGGVTNLNIDFNSMASNPVSGTLSFDQITLNVTSNITDLSSSGFAASIDGVSNGVHGAFFGPEANAVGGNFEGNVGGTHYLGIFGGDKLP